MSPVTQFIASRVHRFSSLLGMLLMFFALGSSAQEAASSVDDVVQQAGKMLQSGQPDKALKLLTPAIEANPNAADLYALRARANDDTGKLDKALADASKYIELKPNDPEGYLNRARINLGVEKLSEALADANKAIELAPNEPDGYYRRSDIYVEMGRKAEAKADEAKAEQLEKRAMSRD